MTYLLIAAGALTASAALALLLAACIRHGERQARHNRDRRNR